MKIWQFLRLWPFWRKILAISNVIFIENIVFFILLEFASENFLWILRSNFKSTIQITLRKKISCLYDTFEIFVNFCKQFLTLYFNYKKSYKNVSTTGFKGVERNFLFSDFYNLRQLLRIWRLLQRNSNQPSIRSLAPSPEFLFFLYYF